jgi:CRP-like cAMP-binding protein
MDERHVDGGFSNGFLRALSPDSRARLRPYLEPVELVRRHLIYSPGEDAIHVYFINRGLVSLVKTMQDGRIVEVGAIGAEGVVCLASLLGLPKVVLESLVQVSGDALRMKASVLREEAARIPALGEMVRGYVQVAIGQLAQTAACNRLHSLDQRCCRWLLMAHDNAGADEFQLTHEFLALMLGVQRPGVSIAARQLQDAGIIRYQNGRVTVVDRPALEASACECYGAVRAQITELYGAG